MLAFRSGLFVVLFYAWSVSISLTLLTLLLFGPRRGMIEGLRLWGFGIIWLLKVCCDIKVEVRGREHLPLGAALVAPKHQCMFDVFAQFAWLPASCFVTKRELKYIPFFSWFAMKAGMIFVDREGHSTALKRLVREAKTRFSENRQVVIFPEGTRTLPGSAGEYKPGIAALYREIDVPVHPMATNSGVHWPRSGFLRKPGTIVFEYLPPIPPGLKRAQFMRALEDSIETASAKLNHL